MSDDRGAALLLDEAVRPGEGDALPGQVRLIEPGPSATDEERRLLCDGEGGHAPPK